MVAIKFGGQLDMLTDVEVGRAWTRSAIELGYQNQVSEYMVIADMDNETCDVCLRLHGKTFLLAPTRNKMINAMQQIVTKLKSPKGSVEGGFVFPFPKFEEVENNSPEQIRRMALVPPFHPLCRCDIVMLC